MLSGMIQVPRPGNEPVRNYAPGSPERKSLERELERMASESVEMTAIIGGEYVATDRRARQVMPHDHSQQLGMIHKCGKEEVERAIAASSAAWQSWSRLSYADRAGVFLKAADLLAGPWRDRILAATMLGQGKTAYQAEIDAACELIDFWRFNCFFGQELQADQPISSPGVWNYVDYRPLEGFVLAITPFNFTAIGANLSTAPALMGNTVIWKPSNTQMLSAWYTMQLLHEAGLPAGVINLLPGDGADVGDPCLASPELAGVHFTGSTATFRRIWKGVGERLDIYRSYPRIVGETGGKDFVLMHHSADVDQTVTALVRGAFEFQGQKCSAASRAFIPRSQYDAVVAGLREQISTIHMGDPCDFKNFIGAVIDDRSFDKISGYIDHANTSDDHRILIGGGVDGKKGYFIEPTVVEADAPDSRLMVEEIFGPVLTIHCYEDGELDATLDAIDQSTDYALTGAIFARDRHTISRLRDRLRYAAGNFYVNDKPTGAVVGQQPFGGGRASGTNDKAGSPLNLLRWISPRAVKETFVSPTDYHYPHQG